MLSNIFIKNFILIESLNLELGNKLNVITGETGAGKSILLDAISFCMNGKFGIDVINKNAELTSVTLTYHSDKDTRLILSELGVDCAEDEEVIITRQIARDGKKKLTINNQPVTQKVLDNISENLITIYGQHSFSNLFKSSSHIKILDNFIEDKAIFTEVGSLYKNIRDLSSKTIFLQEEKKKTEDEIDYLKHVAGEIREAKIHGGEEEELANLRSSFQHDEKKNKFIQEIIENFSDMDGSLNLVSMIRKINRSTYVEDLGGVLDELEKASSHLDEAQNIIHNIMKKFGSLANIEEIEERLFMIRAIARKHNLAADDLCSYLEETELKLNKFETSGDEIKKLEKERAALKVNYLEKSKKLSDLRKQAGKKIENLVGTELAALKMQGCNFKVEITSMKDSELNEKGIDIVNFTASTNPGTPFSSIEKIASGGEMARFMLALQVALFQNRNNMPTIIFDEIDTGIGGAVADAVGTRLKKLSESTQVVAVTHQPQVASKSSHHIKISKDQANNDTKTSASILSGEDRVCEVARMLSGEIITENAKKAALELMGEKD